METQYHICNNYFNLKLPDNKLLKKKMFSSLEYFVLNTSYDPEASAIKF